MNNNHAKTFSLFLNLFFSVWENKKFCARNKKIHRYKKTNKPTIKTFKKENFRGKNIKQKYDDKVKKKCVLFF